ncbi:MAG: HD-GYP domain-containing protein [Solirubrobacteraceae bacterium]|nr:HD-GYP domain-containing protein [Patulibacter sp.]
MTESVAAVILLAACAALWFFAPHAHHTNLGIIALTVVLYAATWQVTFDVGAGTTTPLQLVFVPMWFAVEPAALPLAVAAGQMLGNVISSTRAKERHHWQRVLIGFPDSLYALGPAVVLAVFRPGAPSIDDVPIYALALVAQMCLDGPTGLLREWAATGVRPGVQVRVMVWIATVDSALAPLGLMAAVLMREHWWAVVGVLPLVGLLKQFAKERDDRITKALELSHAYRGTAQLMGDVLEADDAYTGGEHTQGVVELSLAIGQRLHLGMQQMRDLEFGALLHDIGKLRVPNEIINKPGKLDAAEWAIIKQHPGWGQEMLDRVGGVMADAGRIVRAHHERFDGAGYPDGLKGLEIPIEARIITVCDSYSAMTTNRAYRRGMSREKAIEELYRCSGEQFDPQVVDALVWVLSEMGEPATVASITSTPAGSSGRPAVSAQAA